MLFDKKSKRNANSVKRPGYTLQTITFLLLFLMTAVLPAIPLSGTINLQPGLNLLGISIDPNQTVTVVDLINQLGGVEKITRVERFNPQTQQREICDFDEFNAIQGDACDQILINGEGWIVFAKVAVTFNFNVDVDCPELALQRGVNLVAFPCAPNDENSLSLLAKLGNSDTIAALQAFNSQTGRWQTAIYDFGGEVTGANFPIEPGKAYQIHVHRETLFNPNDTDKDGINDAIEDILGTDPNLADTDGDGLDDGEELNQGTDPLKTDTDGDGISDANEINLYHTNPLKADTDGDGISDSEEIAAGSDPNDQNSLPPQPGDDLTRIQSSPANGASEVAVTRETIIRFTRPLAAGIVVDDSVLYAEFGGQRLATNIHTSTDRKTVTLFYNANLPASSRIRVTLIGDTLLDTNGQAVDANQDKQPGGTAFIDFDTLTLTSVAGTTVCGRVFASELIPGEAGQSVNVPLEGVTITVDGLEQSLNTTTDALGNFRLENAPAGVFFVHIDGRTATNGVPAGGYYPFVGKTWESVAGEETNLDNIHLPLIQPETLQAVSDTEATTITFAQSVLDDFPEFVGVSITVPAGSLYADDGTIGGMIGIAPVPPDRIPGVLPPELSTALVITVQTDGATNFDQPVAICVPNLPNPVSGKILAAGEKTAWFSFNHDAGRFELTASMTVNADASLVCSDPGQGILAPGWGLIAQFVDYFGGYIRPFFPDFFPNGGREFPEETNDQPGSFDLTPATPKTAKGTPKDPKDKTPPGSGTHQDSEPVFLFSGEMYEPQTDLRIRGRGLDFIWQRRYRSQSGINTVQGNSWDFSYNIYLEAFQEDLLVYDGNARHDLYRKQQDGSWGRAEFFRKLNINADQSYTLMFEDEGKWDFLPLDGGLAAGKIAAITDRNGNSLRFTYNAQGQLSIVTDTLDRDILIAYDVDGFIASLTDFSGRVVRYQHYQAGEADGNAGDLKSVTTPIVTGTPNGNDFPNGKTTSYTYSTGFADARLNHNLLTVTDGRRNDPADATFGDGPYLINVYADTTDPTNINFDRVVRQVWGGDILDFVFIPQEPSSRNGQAVMQTIVNDRNGNVTEYFWDVSNRNVIKREYTGRANPVLPTAELSNRPKNKLRSSDPDFFETRFEYNSDSLMTRKILPNGNITEYVYESDLNPNATLRSRSNLRIKRWLPGSHAPAGDQPFIQASYEYHPQFNFVTRHTDGRGNVTVHDYDANGNRIKTTHRISSIIEDLEYNPFGQLTAHVLPDNGSNHRRRDEYSYYDSGIQRGYRSQSIIDVDGFNLTTLYQYDSVGNVIRLTDPRGHDRQFVVNALDQVVRSISREVSDGSSVRYQRDTFYDANHNVIRKDIQNINEQGVLQPNTHFSHSYVYEILDFVTQKTHEVDINKSIVTEYQYDNNRNIILNRSGEAVNGNQPANTVRYIYDERDLLFKTIRAENNPDQSSSQLDYDPNKNLVTAHIGLEDNPRVHQTVFDGYDRPVKKIDPMGNETVVNYDKNHNIVNTQTSGELIDLPGNNGNQRLQEIKLTYDAMDRKVRSDQSFFDTETQQAIADGLATTLTFYNDNSQIIRQLDDNNHQTLIAYDTANRRSVVTDHKGNTISSGYDANSNMLSVTEVEKSDLGNADEVFVTTNSYDNLDRLIKRVDNVDNTHEYSYDSRNNLIQTVDALRVNNAVDPGNITFNEYDGINRLLATHRLLTDDGSGTGNPSGAIITRQLWDDNSRLTAQLDDNGNATTYSYDTLNRMIKTTFADSTEYNTTYDVHSNAIVMDDANGSQSLGSFDLLNRVASKNITAGANVANDISFENYQYDGLSRLVQGEDDDSIVKRSYDSLSRVTKETLNNQDTLALYDGVGNQLSCTYPSGRVVTNSYDELDRKQSISDQNGFIAEYNYIGSGRTEQRSYANNTRSDWGYDGVKRIISTRQTQSPDITPLIFDDRTYNWDRMFNKTQRHDLLAGGLTHDYHYDSLYRLKQSEKALGNNAPIVIDYTLDGVGNRTQVAGGSQPGIYELNNSSPEPADFQTNQYSSTAFDQRSYDLNGNLTEINTIQPTQRQLTYDYRNQMVSHIDPNAQATHYAYDVLGRRIGKTINADPAQSTQYFYDGWRVIEEIRESDGERATFVYGRYIDEVLNMQRDGQDFYYHTDDMFNVMKVTDANGNVAERYEYGDYGKPEIADGGGNILAASAIGNPYLFTGRRLDEETGFYYYRTRYLDAEVGRFTTRDTIGIWGDSGNLGNGYAYVGNGPWSGVDPLGHYRYKFKWLIANTEDGHTSEEAMSILQSNPDEIFPFPVTVMGTEQSIEEGRIVKLQPIFGSDFQSGYLRVSKKTDTSFTLTVISEDYLVPPGSTITFLTYEDNGKIYLQQKADGPPTNWFGEIVDPVGAKATWWQQANNLRDKLRELQESKPKDEDKCR